MVIVERGNIIFSLLTFCFYRRLLRLHCRSYIAKSFAACVFQKTFPFRNEVKDGKRRRTKRFLFHVSGCKGIISRLLNSSVPQKKHHTFFFFTTRDLTPRPALRYSSYSISMSGSFRLRSAGRRKRRYLIGIPCSSHLLS